MKNPFGLAFVIAAALFLAGSNSALAQSPKNVPVGPHEISERGIVGHLGLPFGKVVVAEGEIYDAYTPGGPKSLEGRPMIKVTHVNGVKLAKPFSSFFGGDSTLRKKENFGKVKVKCYETCGCEGIAFEAFEKDEPVPAGVDLHFAIWLVIVKRL